FFFLIIRRTPISTLFPYTTLFRSYEKVYELIKEYDEETLPLTRGLSPAEALELYVVNELSRARDRAGKTADRAFPDDNSGVIMRSEEHTSELQSRSDLVCRLLLEK